MSPHYNSTSNALTSCRLSFPNFTLPHNNCFLSPLFPSLVQPYRVNIKREFEETSLHHIDQGATTCI
jgi:hypothetical protein